MSANTPASTGYAEQFLLPDIAAAFWARKIFILGFTLVSGVVGFAGSYLIRPTFRAEVLVVPVAEEQNPLGTLASQFGGLAELAGVSVGVQGKRAAAIATLKSRSLTEAFIRERKLLPVLFDSQWDETEQRWKSGDADKVPTEWDAYRLFDRQIRRIGEDRKSGLVTLSIDWREPAAAAAWANELVKRANAKLQQETISEGQKTIAYLEQQLAKAGSVEVRQALYSLIEVETKRIAVAHAREEFGFKVIDPAVPPKRKVKPSRAGMALGGLFLGFLACSLWIVLSDLTRGRRIET